MTNPEIKTSLEIHNAVCAIKLDTLKTPLDKRWRSESSHKEVLRSLLADLEELHTSCSGDFQDKHKIYCLIIKIREVLDEGSAPSDSEALE